MFTPCSWQFIRDACYHDKEDRFQNAEIPAVSHRECDHTTNLEPHKDTVGGEGDCDTLPCDPVPNRMYDLIGLPGDSSWRFRFFFV